MQAIKDNHRRGIDVSNHQGNIDWDRVVAWFRNNRGEDPWAAGKVTQGAGFRDMFFKQNYEACKQRNISIDGYHFADWGNVQQEVQLFLDAVAGCDLNRYVLDAETSYDLPGDSMTKTQVTDWMVTFLETVKQTGKRVAVYASTGFINQYFDERMKAYDIWVADYNEHFQPGENSIYSKWQAYQYTSKGQIDGIEGNVDLNVCEPEWLTPVEVAPAIPTPSGYAYDLAVAVQQFGFLDSPEYWADVINGKQQASPGNMQLLFEKICNVMWKRG